MVKNVITINVGVIGRIKKNIMGAKNICIWNPATCSCENGKYVESIIDNSVVMCDGIMEETKTIPIKTTAKKIISTNFWILLAVLLMITVIIYFYSIKY